MKNSKLVFLVTAVFIGGHLALVNSDSQSLAADLTISSQNQQPLDLNRIEQAIKDWIRDTVIAAEIRRKGVAFKITKDILQNLSELGAGRETILALREQIDKERIPKDKPTPTPTPTPTPASTLSSTPTCSLADSSKYGFEGDISWVNRENNKENQAITAVRQSKMGMAKYGCYSLELTVELMGEHDSKSKGEAYVNLRRAPPSGESVPIDMKDAEITISIYVPEGANGDHGAQVFVKSWTEKDRYKGKYGDWFGFQGFVGRWMEVKLKPGEKLSKDGGGSTEEGFEPTMIVEAGIKIGTGGNSNTPYKGSIYVDGVRW